MIYTKAVAATDPDTFDSVANGVYVGGTGNLVLTLEDGTTATFTAVPVGTTIPVRCAGIDAATTATNLVALW
tara:strand:+ start:6145 stop:6360 length:216 start_codon:yes stop_codon:yes gene_type:complete